MEEDLGGVLQQQQDQAQAAQAGEGETSLTVPPGPRESGGAAAPSLLPTPPSLVARLILQDLAALSHVKNFPDTEPWPSACAVWGRHPYLLRYLLPQ